MSFSKKKTQEALATADSRVDNWAYLWIAMFTVGGYALLCFANAMFGIMAAKWLTVGIIAFVLVAFVYAKYEERAGEKLTVYVIAFLAIMIRVYYLVSTAQSGYGGLNVQTIDQLAAEPSMPSYAQPLYFIIASVAKYLAEMISFTSAHPFEVVRLLNVYFGVVSVIVIYYITCELETNNVATYICTMLIAFHPSLIMISGRIDQLSLFVMLTAFTVLYLTRWTTFSDGINFIFAGISLGLAAMTDLRALLLLPAVVIFMLVNLVRMIKRRKFVSIAGNIIQMIIGTVLCAVLGGGYPVFCIVRGKPLNWIYSAYSTASGSVGNFPTRFTDFSFGELLTVYPNMSTDVNGWAYFIKTSVFAEGTTKVPYDIAMKIYIIVAAAMPAVCLLMGLMAIFSHMDDKKKENMTMVFVFSLCTLGGYFYLNWKYSNMYTMSFMNTVQVLPLMTAQLGGGLRLLNNKKKYSFSARMVYILTILLSAVFCIGSVVYYVFFL